MTKNEDLELLLHQFNQKKDEDSKAEETKIVQMLEYLLLVIDQTDAYISTQNLHISLFTKHYNEQKEAVLKHTSKL